MKSCIDENILQTRSVGIVNKEISRVSAEYGEKQEKEEHNLSQETIKLTQKRRAMKYDTITKPIRMEQENKKKIRLQTRT